MRAFVILAVIPALTGCIGQSGRTGPGDVPRDAQGAMYTNLPADQIATCFARVIGSNVRLDGTRLLVTSPMMPGATYDVGPNAAGGEYPTEVIVRGRQHAIEEQHVAACLADSLHPASQ